MICPKCHSSNFYQVTDSLYRFICPDCKTEFTLNPAIEEVEKVVFTGLDESCWVELTCVKCGEKIREWVNQFKQPFKCPKCGQKYVYILDVKVIKG
jgi:transcription initiation factor IIE alpha subunit